MQSLSLLDPTLVRSQELRPVLIDMIKQPTLMKEGYLRHNLTFTLFTFAVIVSQCQSFATVGELLKPAACAAFTSTCAFWATKLAMRLRDFPRLHPTKVNNTTDVAFSFLLFLLNKTFLAGSGLTFLPRLELRIRCGRWGLDLGGSILEVNPTSPEIPCKINGISGLPWSGFFAIAAVR